MKREIRIGIFMTIAIFMLAAFIFIVGDFSVLFRKPGYLLNVVFDSAGGLEKRAVVRMAGVKIGYIKDIRLKESRANVILSIDSGIEVPQGSKATLASIGILGEKHLEVLPGDGPGFYQPDEILEGIPPVSFDQMGTMLLTVGEEFREVGRVFSEMFGGEETKANLRDTLSNLSSFSEDLKEFFEVNKESLQQGLQGSSEAVKKFEQRVDEVSQSLNELILLLKDTVEENRENVRINLKSIKEVIDNIEKALRLLNESLEKINKGQGTLGKLIQEPELYEQAERAMDELEKVIHPLSNLRFSGGMRAEYYGESMLKGYFTLSVWPTRTKYLLAQIIYDPWDEQLTYSAQGGIRWGPISPRAGIMESVVGAGIDCYLAKDRLKFSLEGFDFNRNPRPHFRFWARYKATKYIHLLLGIDDFSLAPEREIFFGLEIGF